MPGVGLGLAVARGFAEAMGGALSAEDTPGGGLTMVLSLRTAAPVAAIPALTDTHSDADSNPDMNANTAKEQR